MYYVSKILHDTKTRYIRLEKFIFTFIIYAKKLRPYFQAHNIIILMNQPMRMVLHRPDTLRWIAKWALELSEFHIGFYLKPSIKAQVLANFVLECTILGEDKMQAEGTSSQVDQEKQWMLHVDGLSSSIGLEAGFDIGLPRR